MELTRQNDFIAEKWIVWMGRGLFCLAISAALTLWNVLIFWNTPLEKSEPVFPKISIDFLGLGPLALNNLQSKELQPLLQELVLIGTNTRPDQDHDRVYSLALRSSGEEKKISIGETVFFDIREGKLVFSKEATDFGLTARSLHKGQLFCEVKNKDRSETCALSSSAIFAHAIDQEPYVETLKKGATWGKDVFLTEWGGDEYRDMTKKVKVSLGPDVYFLKAGDCLWWNGDMWTSEVQSDEILPVAQLVKATSNGADFQVWDSTGFSSQTIHIVAQMPPKTSFKMDELMTAIRPRSPSEITCQLGKRRVIVREGDWWIKADNRWKPVRTSSDLEAFLHHQIPGELFIFEKVEASKGKVILKGRAFDRMRTSSEPVSLVMQTEKKQSIPGKPSSGSPHLAKHRSRNPIVSHSEEGL
jgi:hypothetical protein